MRNSVSGLSATSASSAKRICAWLDAPVTTASPASTLVPAASLTRSAPRTATTSPTASTTRPACADATPAASASMSATMARATVTKAAWRGIGVLSLLELIAQLDRHEVARVVVEREVRAVALVLVFEARAPVAVDEVERAERCDEVVVAARGVEERDVAVVVAAQVCEAGVERPQCRWRDGDVGVRAVEVATQVGTVAAVALAAAVDRRIEHRLPRAEPRVSHADAERREIGVAHVVRARIVDARDLRRHADRRRRVDLAPPLEGEAVAAAVVVAVEQDLAVLPGERERVGVAAERAARVERDLREVDLGLAEVEVAGAGGADEQRRARRDRMRVLDRSGEVAEAVALPHADVGDGDAA